MRLGVTKSLGFWVSISMVGVISLGILLSIKHWDWLQGGTENTGNADTVRNVAEVQAVPPRGDQPASSTRLGL